MSGTKLRRSTKRQQIKAIRRALRKDPKSGIRPYGHDKSGSKKRSMTYYSDASAEILRGKPNAWPGLEFRPK